MLASDSESNQGVAPVTFSYTEKPVPVGAHDVAAQRTWEHFQVKRGIERYRRTLAREKEDGTLTSRNLGEVQHGQRIASEIIKPMVAAVVQAQADYAAKLEDPKTRRIADAQAVFGALDAETIAACAVLTALTNPVDAGWTAVRVACAARLRHELEYQAWARAEKEAEKHRKEHALDGVNMFKLMLRRNHGEIDKRVFDKWSKKTDTLVKLDWSHEQKIHIGDSVMWLLVESNGWFEVKEQRDEGAKFPKLVFGMTETALALTESLQETCELQRPFLAPMICEPQDYCAQI
ncbi:hypothetical protein WS83_03270 [Burkholderia sp. MSMB2042]|nr:hypothetical protein WS78_26480 [Burkholderia savannae]KVG44234.1 hypothetical protein WS77_09900 [Burkholderia sp. MSMB0265]KVG87762.1 hypothetical protein WS81_25885 [Burkholderia sp. MSMB2040]KVG96395.1 hypothetical protein WS83_03270 [Burkholderia sp. MSMB2042]KVG97163.1 hypothetical protein WS82_30110 [Burkholderia sp. MSMB2041]